MRPRKIKVGESPSLLRQERGAIALDADMVEALVDQFLRARFDKAVASPPFHKVMWQDCTSPYEYIYDIAPRDHAKSTAGTHAYGLAALLFRVRDNAVIVSNTEDQAAGFLKEMRSECESNPKLVEKFGIDKFEKENDTEWICVFEDKYKFRVTAYGSEQQFRGAKWENKRPNLFLFDDFENVEQMAEEGRRTKIRKIFLEEIIPSGSVDALFRVFGTILHDDSMLARISRNPLWKGHLWRAHKGFDDFTELLWPEKWPRLKLWNRRELYIRDGNSAGYSKEYLNDPVPPEISFFKEDYFQPMREAHYESHERRHLTYYSACDLATGTEGGDYSVILTVGVDELGYMYVVDVRRNRWDTAQLVEQMFEVQGLYSPDLFAIEKGGLEKAIGPWLRSNMLSKSVYLNLEAMTPTKSKVSRASSIQAKCKAKHVFFDTQASWYAGFKDELMRFDKGRHDDQVDAFAYIGLLMAKLSVASSPEEREDEFYEQRFGAQATALEVNSVTGY